MRDNVYGAWRAAAIIARQLDKDDNALSSDRMAETLRISFDKAFFDEELQTYILALWGQQNSCRVRSSNAGHALFTGIAFPARAENVVRPRYDFAVPSISSFEHNIS
ncbi:hypothetical protein EGT36_27600 [Agrobacterium sp. FDAARGOS_525]|nr:hypothetical protein EGT36_27600 [Agrobacterium sp. FDAARGOS_525]